MSCSKIFSGDLPELIYEIIKYFKTDHSTLHSCILVNRLWCRLAIPLLWENPFSISTKNYNFIEIYLHDLNDDLKTKYNISTSNTLFNYSKFIKYLNIEEFISSVKNWSVRSSLFKIFIKNKIELHSLDIEIFNHSFNFDYILELILQNTNFIQNIKNLNLYINHNIKDMVIKDRIIQIVNLQQNLKKILLYNSSFSLYQSLLLSNSFIKKLVISQLQKQDILPYIKKYIMKRQRIKYLAILTENNDLFYLKDEVKEFKLHDIRVRKFSDLFIDTYYHLKNV
ncbi:hypothetical protein RhiirC2_795339 [Rhizophagus irregularis]|uniref:F-box domain-containing protein n=1 Tax=Rhizophagus irregularis TaxID=588596 RepID=A0A2N1MBR7_9GLOM|nr:hypothetical protein RhiirC2_795339 [Rhizophagus irregularis]